jgi:hypothetical protein
MTVTALKGVGESRAGIAQSNIRIFKSRINYLALCLFEFNDLQSLNKLNRLPVETSFY